MKRPGKYTRPGDKLILRCFVATEDIPQYRLCSYAPRGYKYGKVRLMANKRQKHACGSIQRTRKGQKMWGVTCGETYLSVKEEL